MAAEGEDRQILRYNNRDGLLTNWMSVGNKDNEQKMHECEQKKTMSEKCIHYQEEGL